MSKTRVIHERSNIIPIFSELSTNMKEELSPKAKGEYSLKENFFDPSKSSPPNFFMINLNRRLVTYNSFTNFYDNTKDDSCNNE
jgi:hypothetical protein